MKTIFHKILILFLLTSCSSISIPENQNTILSKNDDDLVSTNAALNLSRASYMRGCMGELSNSVIKNKYEYCLNKANKFLEDDVHFILNQK